MPKALSAHRPLGAFCFAGALSAVFAHAQAGTLLDGVTVKRLPRPLRAHIARTAAGRRRSRSPVRRKAPAGAAPPSQPGGASCRATQDLPARCTALLRGSPCPPCVKRSGQTASASMTSSHQKKGPRQLAPARPAVVTSEPRRPATASGSVLDRSRADDGSAGGACAPSRCRSRRHRPRTGRCRRRLCRDVETAYLAMWERAQRGEPPARIDVTSLQART